MLEVCYGIMVWYGMVWYGMVWYDMVLYCMVWYGMMWYGMVWYGMVWYGMVWYGNGSVTDLIYIQCKFAIDLHTRTNRCKFEIEFATENFTRKSIGKFKANLC